MVHKSCHPADIAPPVAALLRSAQSGGEMDYYTGKRTATRITKALQLEISNEPAEDGIVCTSMHNVSPTGCSFWYRKKLDRSQKIYLREFNPEKENAWIEAYVTHCTQGVQGFLVGASFQLYE